MPQRQFPLDPIQTQLTRPGTNVTAPAVIGPQETGLTEGLKGFGAAILFAGKYAKDRQFKDELKTARLAVAKGQVAPHFNSQAAKDLYHEILDMNFADKTIKQAKLWTDNDGNNLANEVGKTSTQKTTEIETVFDEIEARLGFITHSGEALNKVKQALEVNKQELYHSIAQFETRDVEQNGIAFTLSKINERIEDGQHVLFWEGTKEKKEKLTSSFTKSLIKTLENLQTQQHTIEIKGKRIHTVSGLDERKAVLSLLISSVIDNYETNPELTVELEEILEEIYKPLMTKENSLITEGKADSIGDNITINSLIDGYYSDLKNEQKRLDDMADNAHKKWGTSFRLESLKPEQRRVTNEQYENEIIPHFGKDNIKEALIFRTMMDKHLNALKKGVNSDKFRIGLNHVLTGKIKDEQILEEWGIDNLLTDDAIAALKTDLAEKRVDIQENKERIEKAIPHFTWARVHKALGEGRTSKFIAEKLEYLGIDLKEAIEFPQLQNIVSLANHLTTTDEILQPLKDTAIFIKTSLDKTVNLSRKAAYRLDKRKTIEIDETDVTETEITNFINDRTTAFEVLLNKFTVKPLK